MPASAPDQRPPQGQQPPFDPAVVPLVLQTPAMGLAVVRPGIVYKTVQGTDLEMDLCLPPPGAAAGPRPAVVFISGAGRTKHWRLFRDYGQLVTTCGLAAVLYDKRYPPQSGGLQAGAADTLDLLRHVRAHAAELSIDPGRLCVWAFSAGGALVAEFVRDGGPAVSCIVDYYGLSDVQRVLPPAASAESRAEAAGFNVPALIRQRTTPLPPFLVVRAGLDNAALNAALDDQIRAALEKNAPLEFVNYPEGRHGFDILDDTDRSRQIMRRTLAFIQECTGAMPA